MGRFLDEKLDCPKCGTITLDIPENVSDDTPISCSHCGTYLGTWDDLLSSFERQAGSGVFDLNHGRILKR